MSTRELPLPVSVLTEDLDKHLTTAELSAAISVSVRSLERWRITGGGPPFTKIGPRGVRYDLALVKQWLHQNTRSDAEVPQPREAAAGS